MLNIYARLSLVDGRPAGSVYADQRASRARGPRDLAAYPRPDRVRSVMQRLGDHRPTARLPGLQARDGLAVPPLTWQVVALAPLVLICAAAIDYAHAKYVAALGEAARWRAANWSVLQWAAGSVGFVAIVKISIWLLPFEALGLYLGTMLAVRPARSLH